MPPAGYRKQAEVTAAAAVTTSSSNTNNAGAVSTAMTAPILPDSAEVAHLCILAADVIEALPPSLTRSLSDLKELDAVLNASIVAIHTKLERLYDMMQQPQQQSSGDHHSHSGGSGDMVVYTAQQRLELLKEVAEDANAFKLGGEDKIRVATGTAETIIQHTSQLDLITSLLTSLMPQHLLETLPASTTPQGYPHLFPPYPTNNHASSSSNPAATYIAPPSARLRSDMFPHPHQSSSSKSAQHHYSHAVNTVQAYQRDSPNLAAPRPASRALKQHHSVGGGNSHKKKETSLSRGGGGDLQPPSPALSSRQRQASSSNNNKDDHHSPVVDEISPGKRSRKSHHHHHEMEIEDTISNASSSKEKLDDAAFTLPDRLGSNPSPAPSLSSRTSGGGNGGNNKRARQSTKDDSSPNKKKAAASASDSVIIGTGAKPTRSAPKRKSSSIIPNTGGDAADLDFDLMEEDEDEDLNDAASNDKEAEDDSFEPPPSKSLVLDPALQSSSSIAIKDDHNTLLLSPSEREGGQIIGDGGFMTEEAGMGGEVEIDDNGERYCYCQKPSYGEMIGCDGTDCEKEWFHLGCVGLQEPPKGRWYCRDCEEKLAAPAKRRKVARRD